MNLSIKWKIIGIATIIIVFGLGSLAAISSYVISPKTKESVVEESNAMVAHLSNNVETFLGTYENALLTSSESDEIQSYIMENNTLFDEADQLLRADLSSFMSHYEEASGIYFAQADKILFEPHFDGIEDVDAPSRAWYQNSMENPESVVWTEPYVDTATGEYAITGAKAVYAEGEVAGVNRYKDEVLYTVQKMADAAQASAAACEEVSAASDEQLTAIHSVAEASEQLNNLSNELAVAVNRFKL